MATKKATTTDDLTPSAESPAPTPEQELARVKEATSAEVVADVEKVKTVKVKSPLGAVTSVPESLVDALLESGYSKSK